MRSSRSGASGTHLWRRRAAVVGLAAVLGLTHTNATGQEASSHRAGVPSSRFTDLTESRCVDVPVPVEHSGQLAGRRCPGLAQHSVWLLYSEDRYLRVGFGRVGNVSGLFSSDRDANWRVEWRGLVGAGGRFVPFAVILRLRRLHQESGPGDLAVWKLTPDGMACIVAVIEPQPFQNQLARDAADSARIGGRGCSDTPDPLGSG